MRIFCTKTFLIFLAAFFLTGADDLTADEFFPKDQPVRIGLVQNTPQVDLDVRGGYEMRDGISHEEIVSGRRLTKTHITADIDGLHIDGHTRPFQKISLVTPKDVRIYSENGSKRYRGKIDVIFKAEGNLTVVNTVGIEAYIKGVLYHEVSHRWPMEIMKAQAVAARTYALYRIKELKQEESSGKIPAQDFDVTGDIYSQVYGGSSAERFRTTLAVDRTQGQVSTYRGEILPAYFHSSCGGHTESAKNLWKHGDIPPLRGKPCEFCFDSPHNHWKKNIRLKDIQAGLNAKGYPIGLIQEIVVLERNENGRIASLNIIARDGASLAVSGKDFRNIVGPNLIKSNNYEIVMQGYYADLIGRGWGHGVGLCQWGGREMDLQGYMYDEILMYYYPGAELVDYTAVKSFGAKAVHGEK